MNLHFYSSFNNYYNRKLIVYPAIDEYEAWEDFLLNDVNFNPNDGITTNHIVGGPNVYNGQCDYCIVEDENEIVSRWFIIENRRTRGGQYDVILKRDVIADYYDQVLSAPCFIEKGWVSSNDSAIFNKENITFNQIKKKEVLLKDATNSAWLVGYYDRNKTLTATVPTVEYSADYTVNGIANWEYYSNYQSAKSSIRSIQLNTYFAFGLNSKRGDVVFTLTDSGITRLEKSELSGNQLSAGLHYSMSQGSTSVVNKDGVRAVFHEIGQRHTEVFNAAETLLPGYIDEVDYEALLDFSEGERTIFDSATGILYKIGVNLEQGVKATAGFTTVPLTSSLGYELYNCYMASGYVSGSRPTSNNANKADFEVKVLTYDTIQLTLEKVNTLATSTTIDPGASGKPLYSPYGIFAIPYTDNFRVVKSGDSSIDFTVSKSLALRTVNALIEAYGGEGGELYDVQLLPYCPIPEVVQNVSGVSNVRLLLNDVPDYLYSFITDQDNNKVGIYFNCRSTSVKTTKNYVINPKDLKISNETEFCRLVSPNWNGTFEFSPAKNRGVQYFEIDMELKPFQPYIHVAPKWNENGLYGIRSGDAIGLICGGDFGLTMLNDAWAQYERQNKNYQAMFDRQIQNLEVQHRFQRFGENVGALVGTAQGATTGAMTGSFMGGGMGAAIGGVVGGGASALGALGDRYINDALRAETLDYTRDQFGFQLGNIRALPDSLTKVNSFNPNNKIFPILEFYGCTDEETEAIRNKIKYNGMSIGRIGTLQEYLNPEDETYLKGQLIKLEIPEDSHFVNEIASELNKGVRI